METHGISAEAAIGKPRQRPNLREASAADYGQSLKVLSALGATLGIEFDELAASLSIGTATGLGNRDKGAIMFRAPCW